MKAQLTNAQLLMGDFKWQKKAALCVCGLAIGFISWFAGTTEGTHPLGMSDVLELAGGLIVFGSLIVGAIHLLFPYLERMSAENALFIGIDKHRLVVRGVGKLNHVQQVWDLDSRTTFSDSDVLIASGQRLSQAIEQALLAYGGRLAPTIVIMPFWRGEPFNVRPAERYVINEAAHHSQALNSFVIDPGHPLFDSDLISLPASERPQEGTLKGAMA